MLIFEGIYFINVKDITELHFAWYHRIISLLQKYFYNDTERLRAVLGDPFIQAAEFNDCTKKVLKNLCNLDNQYIVKVFEPTEEFLQVLQEIATL